VCVCVCVCVCDQEQQEPLHLQWVGRRGKTNKGRQKKRRFFEHAMTVLDWVSGCTPELPLHSLQGYYIVIKGHVLPWTRYLTSIFHKINFSLAFFFKLV